jgi:hypothetical protein
MKYMNGPSGAGPYNYTGYPAPWLMPSPVAFEGRCLPCDTTFRRGEEGHHISAYRKSYSTAADRNDRNRNEAETKAIRHRLVATRNAKIREVWSDWNQRWKAPHVVDLTDEGKAVMKTTAASFEYEAALGMLRPA